MDYYEGLLLATNNAFFGGTVPLLAQTGDVADSVPVVISESAISADPVVAPQFFITLLSGVILAFGFQLLMTNLSMAAGVSYVAHSSNSSSADSGSGGSGVKKIGIAFGVWTFVTVCLALLAASWLAVTLGLYVNPLRGAIAGLVIWATYFTLLVWFSSTAVGSLVGSVVKSATSGFQTLMGTATAAVGAKGASDQIVQTAEAAAAAVRREFTNGVDVQGVQDSLQDYISSLRSPEVDVTSVEREFERLVKGSDLANADRDALPQVTVEMFEKLLSDRTALSRQASNKLAKRLYRVWQNNTGSSEHLGELMTFVASATGGQLASKGLSSQLGNLVSEIRRGRQSAAAGAENNDDNGAGPVERVVAQGLNSAVTMVLSKLDLADVDANQLVSQIKSAQREIVGQAKEAAPNGVQSALPGYENIIQTDVENYLNHAYIGELKSPQLEEVFRNVIFDHDADETQLREQLSSFGRSLFRETLSARGMLTQDEIRDISNRLEVVRQTVLKDVTTAEAVSAEKRIRQQLETFFKYSPASELSSEMGERAFRSIIENEPLQADLLRDRLGDISADYIRLFLIGRDDVAAHELSEQYAQLLQRVIADEEGLDQAAKVRLQQQQQALEDYLRNTGKSELDPDGIKRDIQTLLNEPDEGIRRVRGRLSQLDRNTLVSLLSERPEFSEQDVDTVVSSVEDTWNATLQAPHKMSAQAQLKYDEATRAIAQYLRDTGKSELSPTGIKRDLQKLMDNPKVGAQALRFRLSKMDRDTLVQLLAQRDDLTEDEINQTIDSVLSTVQGIVKAPRRLARRMQNQAQVQTASFQSALDDYLRHTNKAELNPTGIKRDLQTLLNDPKLGASKLGDRLAQMDDSTMVALLAQRSDMSEEEAAEVVGRIADVRHQIKGQLRSIQRSVESTLDRIFASIRNYLQSLDRPELDYYGIKRDVRTLMDDPQSGFSALSDRLSSFDRDTLVALVTSHDAISERDAYRVIDQVESAKDSVLRKAQSVEQQIEHRLHAVKTQTQQQIEETKAAAEAASWWLFLTAAGSAIAAIGGGLLAT